jgi:hypothetical protein
MKIEKKLIKESVGVNKKEQQTFSSKKQNIVITESQLEKLLEKWFEKNYPDSMVIGVYPMIE